MSGSDVDETKAEGRGRAGGGCRSGGEGDADEAHRYGSDHVHNLTYSCASTHFPLFLVPWCCTRADVCAAAVVDLSPSLAGNDASPTAPASATLKTRSALTDTNGHCGENHLCGSEDTFWQYRITFVWHQSRKPPKK